MGFASFLYRQVFVRPPPLPKNLSLHDQTILITGANSGIGLEAARQCVYLNAATLILAVRSASKGEDAKADILKSNPNSTTNVEVWLLDLESFESVLAFGKRAQSLPRLDVAMLNAGAFRFEWTTSPSTAFESSLQVNHLSTGLLSLLLLPVLRTTTSALSHPTRLTFTSSEVHMWTPFKEQKAKNILARLNDKKFFGDTMDRYSATKLLNVFWALELASRVSGEEVVINLINPGSVDTGLHRDGNKIIQGFDRFIGRTREEGGLLLMDAAVVKGRETHGKYLSEAKLVDVSRFVRSEDGRKVQTRLWDETMATFRDAVPEGTLGELLNI
ncbi:putative 3-oxoacyl-reductase [Cadophora sp. DSE1049]|nr:putative 3-oxoacyl-reductase [Cadophora sp. DSE1049]